MKLFSVPFNEVTVTCAVAVLPSIRGLEREIEERHSSLLCGMMHRLQGIDKVTDAFGERV